MRRSIAFAASILLWGTTFATAQQFTRPAPDVSSALPRNFVLSPSYGGGGVSNQRQDDLMTLGPAGSVVGPSPQVGTVVPAPGQVGSYVPPAPVKREETGPVKFEGHARVVSGGVLSIDGRPIILTGLAGPAADETCMDLTGLPWKCGLEAGRRLEKLIGQQKVRCIGESTEASGGVATGSCFVGREDLARALVLNGFAVTSGLYEREEHSARTNGRGIWAVGKAAYKR